MPGLLGAWPLQMLAMVDGKERTRGEWAALRSSAGFKLARVHRVRAPSGIIEAHPV